jgi:hypothetical protein
LGYYAAGSGYSLLTIRDNISVPSSRDNNPKAFLSLTIHVYYALYQASAAKQIRTALLWAIKQRVVVIPYLPFGTIYRFHPIGHILNLCRKMRTIFEKKSQFKKSWVASKTLIYHFTRPFSAASYKFAYPIGKQRNPT